MTRYFCGMWEYKTQIMDYIHTESFLARLLLKKQKMYICVCDNNGNTVAGVRCEMDSVYKTCGRLCITGFILYDTHYRVKVDSLKNVSIVPVH